MLPVKVYEPKTNNNLFRIIKDMFIDVKLSSSLAKRMFIRDKSAEYRQSVFGILWALFTPLANALIWIFLSASGAVRVSDTNLPYALFVFTGTMIWSVFTDSVNMPLMQTTAAKSLISKINFPKEAILLSGFYKMLFNAAIKVLIIITVAVFFGFYPTLNFFSFLLMLVFLIFIGISLGLLLTPVGMLYTDIGKMIPIILPFLMFLSPVVYKNGKVSSLQKIIEYNPLTPVINSTRNLVTEGGFENPVYLIIIFIVTILALLIGWIFYRISIPIIVERM